jgi:transcription factor C subunit 3
MTSSTIESGQNMSTPTDQDHEQLNASSTKSVVRTTPRKIPSNTGGNEAIFDEPTSSAAGPRLYASQNRIWQALTGHSIDLKKVPSMEFILLSLIASRGVNGITQPDLTVMSGQDKRSVPHRTDELSRKGYIQKMPVQAGKMRTSLCVHKKFVTKDHFLSSGKVEDVFQHKKFVLSGFIRLLHDKLKDSGVVLSRDIRKKLASYPIPFLHNGILIFDRTCQCRHGTNVQYRVLSSGSTRPV